MKIEGFIERLTEKEQLLTEQEVRWLCEQVKDIFFEESNIVPIQAPVIVCGDIHGQFYDVLEIFNKGGDIKDNKYIFIGDFVDRGYNSVETIEYLITLKVLYPKNILLLRGNHESRSVTMTYGFYDEVIRKYGNSNCWKYFVEMFDYLPIGAIINEKVLSIHGGLSPSLKTIDQMRVIERKLEIPYEGPFCDLMWSDPSDIQYWQFNLRGAGWLYGSIVTREFNHHNGLELITRAHQLVQQGYYYWFDEKSVITIWSAPNYCYRCGNVAAIMKFDENMNRDFTIFNAVDKSSDSVHWRNVVPYFL